MTEHRYQDYKKELLNKKFQDQKELEYVIIKSKANELGDKIDNDDFPECVGETLGELIMSEYHILRTLERIKLLQCRQLGINL